MFSVRQLLTANLPVKSQLPKGSLPRSESAMPDRSRVLSHPEPLPSKPESMPSSLLDQKRIQRSFKDIDANRIRLRSCTGLPGA